MIPSLTSRSSSFLRLSLNSQDTSLAALCRQSIPNCCIHIIKNDEFNICELLPYLHFFSAIIVGPGPGSPQDLRDIGIVKDLWKVSDADLLPIFGVCLGLQSLAVEFGARLKKLSVVKHGQISRVYHDGTGIFSGVEDVNAVRYHSLHVELIKGGEIEQLAWADDGIENGQVVMAIKHMTRPLWAVQYHPESVCTQGGGQDVLRNFWRLANNWAINKGRATRPWNIEANRAMGPPWPHLQPPLSPSPTTSSRFNVSRVYTEMIEMPKLTITTICELLGVTRESSPFVLLDSAAQPGRFSIVGSLMPDSTQIKYFVSDAFVSLTQGDKCVLEHLGTADIWSWLAFFMHRKRAVGGSSDVPFWGGLIGYLSYELGVHSLGVNPKPFAVGQESPKNRHPDVNLVFVERSLVLDSITGKLYLQSLIPHDWCWFADTISLLRTEAAHTHANVDYNSLKQAPSTPPRVTIPDKHLYKSRIGIAKEHLFDGQSYELCLTAHTRITIPASLSKNSSSSSSWERYKTLRTNNPAPYSAYIRLHPTTLLSSSPERFLSFSRPPGTMCHLRPIKGTVQKSPEITRAVAEQLLAGSTKEVAENLMIVDLIRHDLHGVLGEDVHVKQFCGVEEYETVWQLVSVIEGRLPPYSAHLDYGELGWEVLRRSLPPGIFASNFLPDQFSYYCLIGQEA